MMFLKSRAGSTAARRPTPRDTLTGHLLLGALLAASIVAFGMLGLSLPDGDVLGLM